MLLESRINDKATVIFDCENSGGLDKGAVSVVAHPDRIVPYAMDAIRAVAAEMGAALTAAGDHPPVSMKIEFSVRVDANAVVQIARNLDMGQFRVTLQWDS